MSYDENELDREVRALAEQLSDDKVDAIARRLRLRGDERVQKSEADGHCSFCGRSKAQVGAMVSNGADARICRPCLSHFAG